MSIYKDKTAEERKAMHAARKPGDPVPRCGANFSNVDADCDIYGSHICGISERWQLFNKFFEDAYWSK